MPREFTYTNLRQGILQMKGTGNGRMLKRQFVIAGIVLVALCSGGYVMESDADLFLKINRSIDLFGRVYKEITANYVDEVDPEKFMEAGIDGMLGTLDPYTVYIDKEDGDEVDLLTNGKYGGIGITIGVRDGAMRVISVMDGYSAQRQGILPGDVLLEVGGVPVATKKPDEVRNLTRGDPGTEVNIKIQRDDERSPLEFALVRQEIQVKNVTYADYVDQGIGYVRLERFSRRASEEVRQAIKDLKLKGDLKGLVLDLRGNPGGLLDAAVEVAGKFLPRGSMVVSTKGRSQETDKKYYSAEEPILPTAPVVVLTDHGSASASEIVSGALQDLDRAVVVGTRSFGKGLVQTILPLDYGAQLKITTARYFTPSGRCIQEIDYMHKDKNGVFAITPDSLRKEFHTAHGRKVFEHGGVTPDSVVKDVDEGPMVKELQRRSLFFKFVNKYVSDHKLTAFSGVTNEIMTSFRAFLETAKFDYQEDSETKVKELRETAEKTHYSKEVLADIDHLLSSFKKEKVHGFDRYSDHLADELNVEFSARLKGEQGRIKASLEDDPQLKVAIGMLKNGRVYEAKIGG
jgi:carboxyl-terminal processing protease